jgi:hypothetical protein
MKTLAEHLVVDSPTIGAKMADMTVFTDRLNLRVTEGKATDESPYLVFALETDTARISLFFTSRYAIDCIRDLAEKLA